MRSLFDQRDLARLIERIRRQTRGGQWSDHPVFGPMTREDWGRFSHRHFDHHLRQFGV